MHAAALWCGRSDVADGIAVVRWLLAGESARTARLRPSFANPFLQRV